MKRRHSMIYVALLIMTLFFWVPANAMAKGIFEHQNTTVPVNQTTDDVVVVGGDATILGTVKNSVIVFNGDLDLKASAKINGFVVVVGGQVLQEPGSFIRDEIINLSFDHATLNSLMIGGGLVIGTWLLQLAVSVLLVILPVIAVFLSKGRIHLFVERARRTPGHFIYIGFFSTLILVALSVLLLITVIGIPIALLIMLFVGLASVFGLAVLSMLVGERIQVAMGRSDWSIALTGSIVLVSLLNVPFVGGLLLLGIVIFSTGVMTLWILEKLKRKTTT
ncbi:hypothetical protein [Paenibacillus brasilensis]|uniref:Uncharacterized protein n=1 Tax=Paenibacillus brasilensis TaxID=128574 RepID=A0ABU0L712_9BACL|nr:hypothetical protein [Paenibacillus brasilensis]MDQ0497062.1 hypothetical protein [Paenibacillus brasilensis]